jgi:hypothetical protein
VRVGSLVGKGVGDLGKYVGDCEGIKLGGLEGSLDGRLEGFSVGRSDGSREGVPVVGELEGSNVGLPAL